MRRKIIFWLLLFLLCFTSFYRLENAPEELDTDEISWGYNAFSILETGRDEHRQFLPLSLRAYGDYRSPSYVYLGVSSIYLFGLTASAVRLPAALMGLGTIYFTYLIVKQLFNQSKEREKIALSTLFLLIISPWHLQYQRMAIETNAAVFFVVLGIYWWLKSLKRHIFLPLSFLVFALSIYSYHSERIFTPIFLLLFSWWWLREKRQCRQLILAVLVFIITVVPLVYLAFDKPEMVLTRPQAMSIFSDKGIRAEWWEDVSNDENIAIPIVRFFHPYQFYLGKIIVRNYLSHFDAGYLFFKGDSAMTFMMSKKGPISLISLPFLIYGIYLIIKQKEKHRHLLFCWLVLPFIVPALTITAPSFSRSVNFYIPLTIFIAYGLVNFMKKRSGLMMVVVAIYLLIFLFDWFNYFVVFQKQYGGNRRQLGFKNLVSRVKEVQDNYEKIFVSDTTGDHNYIFFLFYQQYPPEKFWQTKKIIPAQNLIELDHVASFDKYIFLKEFMIENIERNSNYLYVGLPNEIPINSHNGQTEDIYDDNGRLVFRLLSFNK